MEVHLIVTGVGKGGLFVIKYDNGEMESHHIGDDTTELIYDNDKKPVEATRFPIKQRTPMHNNVKNMAYWYGKKGEKVAIKQWEESELCNKK